MFIFQGDWGLTEIDTDAELKRSENFQRKFIPSTRAQLRVLHQSYQVQLSIILFKQLNRNISPA